MPPSQIHLLINLPQASSQLQDVVHVLDQIPHQNPQLKTFDVQLHLHRFHSILKWERREYYPTCLIVFTPIRKRAKHHDAPDLGVAAPSDKLNIANGASRRHKKG
ncbi:hypothetical protein M5K25_012079 [Dendrobium thyrsiflorum]|uniref:Uncharacterized protein n=1 Tax=Dendrobium thyrsiflorum TaxID=117978 RepID=A0ABD0UWP5_DENTH